jgi:hypothetical protein
VPQSVSSFSDKKTKKLCPEIVCNTKNGIDFTSDSICIHRARNKGTIEVNDFNFNI